MLRCGLLLLWVVCAHKFGIIVMTKLVRGSFCESREGVRLPRKKGLTSGEVRETFGEVRGTSGEGSLGNFRGTSGLF